MKPVIWIIGGTSEGRALIKELADLNINIYVSVATAYGAELIEAQENVTVLAGRLNLDEMREFLRKYQPEQIIDATHPYAELVTATVKKACLLENANYLRLLRPVTEVKDCINVYNFDEAVELLNQVEGNIFLTTGSKNLKDFTAVQDYQERIALRILPMEASLHTAIKLGYKASNIICMQGPFSKELNVAMLRKYNSSFMVTKDSGEAGGFTEKVQAAAEAGAKLLVIGRTVDEQGESYNELVNYLRNIYKNR